MSQKYQDSFVTVVSVGIEDKSQHCTPKKAVNNSEYITVLTIGNEETKTIKDVTEEVIVYRLPGERLGFGLKFEGGTKAHEFVKRLFIQSCAPDSPASRVQSSWGQLVEGDEVLEIDSIPVNSMTRIDCVRFLKDSNVAIKLLVKHCFNTKPLKQKSKSSEDLPVIVSTEEKRPPPVPPRKLHRKLHKSLQNLQNSIDNVHENVLPLKQQESFSSKSSRLQSPRNSFRKKYSPDVSRRLSDGSLGPADAEVYLDLISQESTQSLSESDDTGSTISTVLDRFASFPTTTTSSFAGSLPSTPTSIQKQLDFSYIINDFPEDDLHPIFEKKSFKSGAVEENNNVVNGTHEDNIKCLQEVQQIHIGDETDCPQPEEESSLSIQPTKRPVVIPRSRDRINKQPSKESENTLPRLVDFVPKSPQKEIDAVDTLKRFLESERFDFEYIENDDVEASDMDFNMDPYSSKWLLSSHLSTIGEDEEEQSGQEFSNNFSTSCQTPRVTIDTVEQTTIETAPIETNTMENNLGNDNKAPMEIPPSDSRQPPDGHEFPDFIETSKITVYSETIHQPVECVTKYKSSWSEMSQTNIATLDRSISSSNCDLRQKVNESDDEKYEAFDKSNLLHNRSQSLIDVSIFSKDKSTSKWNTLVEQRKRRLSKLKGLVIPETSENDITPQVNIPEIRSITTSQIDLIIKPERNLTSPVRTSIEAVRPLVLPTWSSNVTLPKYSPAFKRKSLQVYPASTPKRNENSDPDSSFDEYIIKYSDSTPSRTTDDPKSLESIASPTRSDCSFDYTSLKTAAIKDHHMHSSKDFGDSDNDSAVSSSQSSYNSRSSPPPSPISEDKLNGPNRLLKPFSVEAINRKNILASAKCRSGKDIKIGSPVIQRKTSLEEDKQDNVDTNEVQNISEPTSIVKEEINVEDVLNEVPIDESVVLRDKPYDSVVVNEPVVLEVHVERTTTMGAKKIEEKVVERPIPSRRSVPPALPSKENKLEQGDRRLNNLLGRHTASSLLEKRNKPVNIQSLRANFENSNNSMPVFPKNYKADNKVKTPPEWTNGKPTVTTRRRSEESLVKSRRKSDDKLLFEQISQEEVPKFESRRLSNSSISRITQDEQTINLRSSVKKEEVVSRISSSEKSLTSSTELRTIELSLDQAGGSLGITLAGGVDYENKNVTIHRIRYGSVAYQDGRLKKGDKVISINGVQTAGMTHSEATELLKLPCTKFTIVIEETIDVVPSSNLSRRISSSITSLSSESKASEQDSLVDLKKPTNTITLIKDGAGLGFSIEGGKDSPKGDVPLIIKKVFTGGAAEKCGELRVGDQILSVNAINFQNLSRIEAWTQMKKIPEGVVNIEIFR